MAKIEGIKLPPTLGASLEGSPEEAAKAFMRAASEGLAIVMRDALNQAVGEAVGAGATPDWTKLITGCSLRADWTTPPGTIMQTVVTVASGDTALGGGSISVTGTWTF